MKAKRITVLRGGPSEENFVSMRTGADVIKSLSKRFASVDDIVVSKQGEWLQQGLVRNPDKVMDSTDVVFLALHGAYGEDGEVQKLLQRHNIPFTGSRSLPSAVAFNKRLTKDTLQSYGIAMPKHRLVKQFDLDSLDEVTSSIKSDFGPEYILKPIANGSSLGMVFVREGQSLADALQTVLKTTEQILVEEFIRGREATCAVLESYRNEDLYVFPAMEIIPPIEVDFYTTDAKYSGLSKEVCPANFSYKEKEDLATVSALVHKAMGLSQYSRSDFIVKNNKPYFLEVNTLPGLAEDSVYTKAAMAVGLDFDDLVEHLVETATT